MLTGSKYPNLRSKSTLISFIVTPWAQIKKTANIAACFKKVQILDKKWNYDVNEIWTLNSLKQKFFRNSSVSGWQ